MTASAHPRFRAGGRAGGAATTAAALVAAIAASAPPARGALPRAALERVAVRPPPGAAEPMSLAFLDADAGGRETLAQAAGGRPLVLVFADFACATLCGPALAVTGERLAALADVGRDGAAADSAPLLPGRDWRLAVVGLAPGGAPAAARAFADARLPTSVRRATAVLIGDAAAVRRATAAAGYGYAWDPAARQFAHPVAAFVLAPDGRLVRTLSEVALTPPALAGAIRDARAGRVGALLQGVALVCHGALEAVGRFDGAVLGGLRGAALATLAALALLMTRRRRRVRA